MASDSEVSPTAHSTHSLDSEDILSPLTSSPFAQRVRAESDNAPAPSFGRKVSFHSSTVSSPSDNRQRPRVASPDAEGSADENTPVLSKERRSGKGYSTTAQRHAFGRGQSTGNDYGSVRSGGSVKNDTSSRRQPLASQIDGGDGGEDAEESEPHVSRWRKLLDKYGTVELENKGSVARDHLALERTFLAWLRTSLSFASIGIAITQLFRLNTTINSGGGSNSGNSSQQQKLRHVGKPLGATFLAIGIVTLFIGFHRYFESQHYVILGRFPASRGSVIIIAILSGALIIASFVVVLTISPQALDR